MYRSTHYSRLKNELALAAEYEIASAFENSRDATVARRVLIKIYHLRPPNPVQLHKTTSNSFTQRSSKKTHKIHRHEIVLATT